MRSSNLAWKQCLCLFALLFCAYVGIAQGAVDPAALPKPTSYVSDLAHVIDSDSKAQLETFCTRVETELGVQFAFVTIDTIGDADIRDFALKIFRTWGVGDRKTNQGVLVLLAIKDHKSDLETGRGIEPYLTDGFSGSTLRAMRADLRGGNYGASLLSAAHAMAQQIAQGKNIAFADSTAPVDLGPREEEPARPVRRGGGGLSLFVIGAFILLWLLSRGGRRGGGGGGSFLTGMLLGNLLSGGGRSGGGWGGGGGFGGGDSGGGGGFGGFGGGDAGGGGASSDW